MFLHGTTSGILDILPYTEFKLMSAIDSIREYSVVTYTGEIFGGGYGSVGNNCQMCFGRITACHYDLEKIMNYTLPQNLFNSTLEELVTIGKRCAYSNINLIIITAMREQQMGKDISSLINEKLYKDILLTINALAVLFYFDSYIFPVNKLDIEEARENTKQFTLNYIKSSLCDFSINLMDHRENPSEEILNKLLSIFPGFDTKINNTSKRGSYAADYLCYRLTQEVSGYKIEELLAKYCNMKMKCDRWYKFKEYLYTYLNEFLLRLKLLESIVGTYKLMNFR